MIKFLKAPSKSFGIKFGYHTVNYLKERIFGNINTKNKDNNLFHQDTKNKLSLVLKKV